MNSAGTAVREGPAMRLHMEQLEKRVRRDREHDEAIRREELHRARQESTRRVVDLARATGGIVHESDVVWVDHPTADGRS